MAPAVGTREGFVQCAAPAPPGIPLLLCINSNSGSDSTKQAPNSRNSCSNESISACRVTWPSTIASALALASGAGVPVAMIRATMALSRSRASSLYWVTLAIRSPRWIAVNRCTRVAEMAIPTLPPSWRIRLKSPVPFGILLIGRSASARFVSGTKISPRPTPRKISGQKKSDMPLSVVKWACFHMDSAKIATPARIESRASNLPVVRPIVAIVNALASAFTMATMGRTTGKFDARLSILAGVAIFALSMWKHAHFTTDSGMSDFFWPLIFRGLGLIFVPLTNLALADLPMSKIPNGTWLFNLMRQLGGSVRIAVSATLLQRFQAIHRADLIANVTQFSEAARERLSGIVGLLIAKGTAPALAEAKALRVLDGQVTRQALMLSFEQLFLLFGACFVLSLPLLLLMHRSKGMPGGAGAGAAH